MSETEVTPDAAVVAVPAPEPVKAPPTIVALAKEEAVSHEGRKYVFSTWVPSMGHFYDGKFPGGEVLVSPITVAEERILGAQKDDRSEILDMVIKRCIVKMPVAYEDLLLPDMVYLLFVIRNISYGADYKFTLKCSNCRQSFVRRLNIPDDISLRCLGPEDKERNDVALPMVGKTVTFRPLRCRDEQEIRKWAKKQYSMSLQDGDPAYVYRMAKHIVAIDGKEAGPLERLDLVEGLIARDSLTLKRAFEKQSFGCVMKLDTECSACGHREKSRIPLDREFFQPSDESDQD